MDLVPVDADVFLYKDMFEDNRGNFFLLVHLSFIQSIDFETKDRSWLHCILLFFKRIREFTAILSILYCGWSIYNKIRAVRFRYFHVPFRSLLLLDFFFLSKSTTSLASTYIIWSRYLSSYGMNTERYKNLISDFRRFATYFNFKF